MEVKIQYEGKDEVVILRKLKWGENNDCVRKSTSVVKGVTELDQVTLHEQRLLKSIETAPFEKTIEGIRDLEQGMGDLLFNKMQELNTVNGEQTKNLETPSSEES